MVQKPEEAAPVHILSAGPFGQSVTQYLKNLWPNTVETVLTGNEPRPSTTWHMADVRILVAGRPMPKLCEWLDGVSHQSGRPCFPVVLDSTALRLGPVVVPGKGGCWRCWILRSAQQADWSEERSALHEYYSSNAATGPRGYLEPFAMIAASQIAQTLRALATSSEAAGYIWQMDLLTGRISTSTLVGIHNCPQCGLHRPALMRSVAEMRDALAGLWNNKSDERE
jgi:bacteriocin biosynthesis cyclodehydratase domain-containing protein